MIKKLFAAALFCAFTFAFQASASAFYPTVQNEKFVIKALQQINGAQYTYAAAAGNGGFGTFSDLQQSGLIDAALADGFKYGYVFSMQVVNGNSPAAPSTFRVTAAPRVYRKSGRRSFYADAFGTLRGADKNGAPATAEDPLIEDVCAPNEECTISNLRTLNAAEVTYMMTTGDNNFGTLTQLRAAGFIGELLARSYASGYNFTVTLIARTNNSPASFAVSATPITYGITGVRSFYTDETGVMRGADKHGAPATANDPAIE